ncbi:variable surface protein Vir12-related [Plasmodium vivax]|uniref:Variable surface protein Vir12-related n=1 Tax=Plasmodium vivax (strain Salvador I) TaxID=126793 RepID=A5KD24_PLAVS|nr:variable surface protein Vir12-related [Plasmodium vivax]EDL42745.1 variable surface protein Vir12-related [Plasmodium vivax]|eukprot:XP_001612538.1 variable surface protein Vir12-related [Plasmodium vivax Sal-1]
MAQKTPQPNLAFEKSSEYLKLNTLYEEFFKKDEKINIDNRCNNLNNPNGNDKDVRELCSKVVSYLEKIPMVSDTRKRNNYCSYLPYWFYDEIGRIHKDHSKKMDDIPIFKDIMGVANKVNVPPKTYKCTLKYDKNVNLDELLKRKISHIYFKKHDNIKSFKQNPQTKDCNHYFTYLTYIKSLYEKYHKEHCSISWLFSSDPDYFSCTSAYNPKDFLSTAEKCKAKENGGGSGSFFDIFWGSSSSGTSSNRSGTSIQAPARAATSEAKMPGNAKNSSPGGLPENKGVKGATGVAAAGNVSKGLSSSTSPVTAASSTRPGAEAPVRDNVLSRGGLLGQAVTSNHKGALSPSPKEGPGQGINAVPPYTSDTGNGKKPALPADSPSTLESVPDNVDSKFYRNIIMGVAIIGTIFFLIYYNMSSRLKSRFPKRKRKKKIFEHNYYEEYEKELARYESENESLDSQSDRYYLNYQPEGDYYY